MPRVQAYIERAFPTFSRIRKLPRATCDRLVLMLTFVLVAFSFTDVFTTLTIGLFTWLAYEMFYRRNLKVLLLIASCVVSLLIFEWVGAKIIRARLAQTHATDVDHRMHPHAYPWVNGDGIRCKYESRDFTADTFNVICMGDSFCYGECLENSDDTFPNQLEAMAREKYPERGLRAINFGWTSSSPIITLKQLREIGPKYKPDLVIYCLDMTDFHDDLRRRMGVDNVGAAPADFLIQQIGAAHWVEEIRRRWRFRDWIDDMLNREELVPKERFFITARPLDASRDLMEETARNLNEINAFCRNDLKCDFLMFMFPRTYQYSTTESLESNERILYKEHKTYVMEPFVWLEELKKRVDYPAFSLYDDFKNAREGMLSFPDDPHWTPAGHRVVARSLMRILKQQGYLTPKP